MNNIFQRTAQTYWEHGLPVIPLTGKRPCIGEWSSFCRRMPNEIEQNTWLARYANGNIGLALGSQSRICILDIDTDNPKLQALIHKLLPPSPWMRVGKKGMALAYRFHPDIRTFQVYLASDKSPVCEVLADGRQVALPPSIHPDTHMPYTANRELVECLNQLPPMPADFEKRLREALVAEGYNLSTKGYSKVTEWVPAGGRDNRMVSMAGLFARDVLRGLLTFKEAAEQIEAWCANFTEQVAGDPIDPKKGIARLAQFVARDVYGARRKVLPTGWDDGLTGDDKRDLNLDIGAEKLAWSFTEIKEHLVQVFHDTEPNDPRRAREVEAMLDKIAYSTNDMSPLNRNRLIKWIADTSLLGVNIAAIKEHIKHAQADEMKGENHTEIALAVIADLEVVGEVRVDAGKMWQWAGSHWVDIRKETVISKIAEDYGHLPLARRAGDHNGIWQTIVNLKTQPLRDNFAPAGVNFANGFLTKDLVLHDHEPQYGMIYCLPYRYVPEEASKTFQFHDFLRSCWGDEDDYEDRVCALREAIASIVFGESYKYQRAFLFYGLAGSGKSTLKEIVRALLPDTSISNIDPSDWGDKFLPTQMAHKLLNICGELSNKKNIDGQRFKTVVEGEIMPGQYKGEQIFNFAPRCGQLFCSNHLPRTEDTSTGFSRRWLIFSFNRIVPREEKIVGLHEQIVAEEREGILAWAVGVMAELEHRGDYVLPASHVEIATQMASDNNSVRYFFEEGGAIKPQQGSMINESDLYSLYYTFMRTKGAGTPVSVRPFRAMMRELGGEKGFSFNVEKTDDGTTHAYYADLVIS